ncbi:MAG: hypothetical protein AAGB12_13285 [Pseudomonadota bacterium]
MPLPIIGWGIAAVVSLFAVKKGHDYYKEFSKAEEEKERALQQKKRV